MLKGRMFFMLAGLALVACGGGAGAVPAGTSGGSSGATQVAAPTQLPSPSTQWVYSLSYTDTSTRSGTLTMTYLGTQTFRGTAYYALQTADSLQNPTYIVSYMQPAGSGFAEFGATQNQAPFPPSCPITDQAEDTLDTLRSFYGSSSSVSGTETLDRCSFAPMSASYSISVVDMGTTTRTVPAGTFAVHAWQTTFVTFGQTIQFRSYQAGSTVIERDGTGFFSNGNVAWTSSAQLQSGPLNVLFPGPPTISAGY
jgi:hypothetical protein